MTLFLSDPDFHLALASELPEGRRRELPGIGWLCEHDLTQTPLLAFARQTLPQIAEASAVSINAWADRLIDAVAGVLPDDQPWQLHLWPEYGEGRAGLNRCELIRTAMKERLKKRRRHLLRLWLACEDGPALPPFMTADFQGSTATGRPDGIRVPGVPLVAPLEA